MCHCAVYQDQSILLRILTYKIIGEYILTRTEETGLRVPSKPSPAPGGEASGPAGYATSQIQFQWQLSVKSVP